MSLIRNCLTFCCALFIHYSFSQAMDVQHYKYELELSDEQDRIDGKATAVITFLQPVKEVLLDLVQPKGNGKGMKVNEVKGVSVAGFQQVDDKIKIQLKAGAAVNRSDTFQIFYSGVPADGLIISKNKYGDRTFFSDNWPNRAHHWIPCNDIPSDKASVEFLVTAPAYYQVISNGIQVEETNLDKTKKLTYWKEETPIPTKVMVIGAARFAVGQVDTVGAIPVSAWVYPQDRQKGFYDYALSASIMRFFIDCIGPYPFQKLANVQSKTIFGGMENASAIFYTETSVTGNRSAEDLLAHEVAHQWFGNMATEKSFAHLWLSEGFATYLTNIYFEKVHGREAFIKRLQEEREQVIKFSRVNKRPVVDSVSDLMDLLNANSYQKGGWVLHMLRGEIGDNAFQQVVRTYYEQYKGRNAETKELQATAEKVSGKSLDVFFRQWLHQPGVPKLKGSWRFSAGKLNIKLDQISETKFSFPLEVGMIDAAGKQTIQKIMVTPAATSFDIPVGAKPVKIILDPNTALLFEGSVSEGR